VIFGFGGNRGGEFALLAKVVCLYFKYFFDFFLEERHYINNFFN
jgi:hypothetical protein